MSEILIAKEGTLGHIKLNRPKAINALTHEMIASISTALATFAADDGISAVLVTGEGERGLCAGGDIRALYEHRASGQSFGMAFFRDEYRMNAQISAFPKPYIAFMDGITMGGGVGVSAHGSVRIVTERTRLAMPETGIGFFPDVGASWLLSRAPGELGTYLALTGQSVTGADAILAGLADKFVPSIRLPELGDALTRLPRTASTAQAMDIVTPLCETITAPLSPYLEDINQLFRFDDVRKIISALKQANTDFAYQTLEIMASKSPTCMQVALRLIRLARHAQTLNICLQQEYTACAHVLTTNEFYEGVRAAVVDKDRMPKWHPSSLDGVTETLINPYFTASVEKLF
ncbi:enoyl-CoA hydratase/isomerase family protein [Acidocella sp.]|uniref:enoyl-CoA hydratase/isomerase family protein n=1 Tax=Acidocella sp. TaxID=50710 RepID=UPI003D070D98